MCIERGDAPESDLLHMLRAGVLSRYRAISQLGGLVRLAAEKGARADTLSSTSGV